MSCRTQPPCSVSRGQRLKPCPTAAYRGLAGVRGPPAAAAREPESLAAADPQQGEARDARISQAVERSACWGFEEQVGRGWWRQGRSSAQCRNRGRQCLRALERRVCCDAAKDGFGRRAKPSEASLLTILAPLYHGRVCRWHLASAVQAPEKDWQGAAKVAGAGCSLQHGPQKRNVPVRGAPPLSPLFPGRGLARRGQ